LIHPERAEHFVTHQVIERTPWRGRGDPIMSGVAGVWAASRSASPYAFSDERVAVFRDKHDAGEAPVTKRRLNIGIDCALQSPCERIVRRCGGHCGRETTHYDQE
jgi:hypothetical protein